MKRYMYEPRSLFSKFIEAIVLTAAAIVGLKYLCLYVVRNWWVILIAIIILVIVVLVRIYKYKKNQRY